MSSAQTERLEVQATLENVHRDVQGLLTELRCLENLVRALLAASKIDPVAAPETFRKFQSTKDSNTYLCTTDFNPGSGWKRVCKDKTWATRQACDAANCPS